MAQKGSWNLAQVKIMKERRELLNVEGDAVPISTGRRFQIIFHCIHHLFFILAPTDYHLFLRLSQACLPPSISCRGRRILSPWCSFVFVPSRPLGHQKIAQTIQAEKSQKFAPSFVSCFFQDSPESTSPSPNRSSNSSTSTFTL